MYTVVGQEQSFSSVHFLLHTKHINSCSGYSGSSGTSEDSTTSGVSGASVTSGVSETSDPSPTSEVLEAVFTFERDSPVLTDVSV